MLFNIIHTYRYHDIAEACVEFFHQELITFSGGQKYFHQCQNLQFWRLPPMPPMRAFSSGAETYYFEFHQGNIQRCIPPPQICSSGAYASITHGWTRLPVTNLLIYTPRNTIGCVILSNQLYFSIMQNIYSNLVIQPN